MKIKVKVKGLDEKCLIARNSTFTSVSVFFILKRHSSDFDLEFSPFTTHRTQFTSQPVKDVPVIYQDSGALS